MTIQETHQSTLWFQKLEEIARARHEAAQEPSLGARIRANSKQTIANNPYMPMPDPGFREGISQGTRGYGPSNMVLLQLAYNGVEGVLPTERDEWPERFER